MYIYMYNIIVPQIFSVNVHCPHPMDTQVDAQVLYPLDIKSPTTVMVGTV